MTQRALAQKSGVDSAYISRAEGHVLLTKNQADKIAAALEWKGDSAELLEEVEE